MANGSNGRSVDAGIRLVLEEIRDLRREMRDDRRRADADRRQVDANRRRSDETFQALLRDFREDSARRDAAFQRAFRDIRTVGLSIVKTLNRHTQILERIDRKLGGRNNVRPDNGRAA